MPSSLEGPMIRSHACRLNFEVCSFLMLQPNIHEDGMLLNFWDVLLLRNMESTNTPASNSAQSDNNYMHKTEFTWQVPLLHVKFCTKMVLSQVYIIHGWKVNQVYFPTQQTEHHLDFPIKRYGWFTEGCTEAKKTCENFKELHECWASWPSTSLRSDLRP